MPQGRQQRTWRRRKVSVSFRLKGKIRVKGNLEPVKMRTRCAGQGTCRDRMNIWLLKQLGRGRFSKQPVLCLGGSPSPSCQVVWRDRREHLSDFGVRSHTSRRAQGFSDKTSSFLWCVVSSAYFCFCFLIKKPRSHTAVQREQPSWSQLLGYQITVR